MAVVYAWGLGKSGQLGNGKRANSELPEVFQTKRKVVSLSCGALFTGVVTTDGKVATSGCGKYGRLGGGNENDRETPTEVEITDDTNVKEISCGCWHACAITDEGQVLSWGFGRQHGVFGCDGDKNVIIPTLITSLQTVRIAGVSCGNNFTLAWTSDGEALSWGYGHYGVLGHGDEIDQTNPKRIQAFDNEKVVNMNAGFAHCGAVTESGGVFMFGKGKDHALGLGKVSGDQMTPKSLKVLSDARILGLSCSVGEHHGHTLAVDDSGTVHSWGDGYKGKLGLGDTESRLVPTQIPQKNFNGEFITQVSAGGIHSAAVSREGHVFTWGCGSDGRLGHPEAKGHRYLFKSDVPRVVDFLEKVGKVKGVSCSYYHTAAMVTTSRTKDK
ncbi:uncharacterized protein LOC135484418 [Lineus longissimus]|uniref:uncharacterized protein LOC135484418 n=1 Tax=Lineus longissimus TaxID=88925 RepID=UPI002B4CF8B3